MFVTVDESKKVRHEVSMFMWEYERDQTLSLCLSKERERRVYFSANTRVRNSGQCD